MNTFEFVNQKIMEIIIKYNLIDKNKINGIVTAIEDQKQHLHEYLLKKTIITDEQFILIKSDLADVKLYNIDLIAYDANIVKSVSKEFVTTHHLLPLSKINERYIVSIGDVLDLNALNIAKTLYGYDVIVHYTTMAKIHHIHQLVHSKSKLNEALDDFGEVANEHEIVKDAISIDVSTAPTVRLCESLLREAIASKASDIHIEPYEDTVRVRNRIDGVLYERASFELSMYQGVVTRFKIISGVNITERRIPQDGRFNMVFNDVIYDFRFSTLPTIHGEKVVIRILDNSAFNYSLSELGFTKDDLRAVVPLLRRPYGIILLTGPTGCGKTTTLYSFIREINSPTVNIVSVEDPVEYSIEGINQVQVNTKANMTFASALRSILRQDPNIIMIGEIRDEETAHIAIRSAITGHLVFSTLHTSDALGAVARLSDMGVATYLVADAVQAVIAQRLVRRLCLECRHKIKTTVTQTNFLGYDGFIYEAKGCPACHNTGYKGRVAIYEILIIDETIRNLINQHRHTDLIKQHLKTNNFINLRQACNNAVIRGDVSFEELLTIENIID